jgi:hypothetical protein
MCHPRLVFLFCLPQWRSIVICLVNSKYRTCSVSHFFFPPTGDTVHCGFVFCSPLAGFSLLAYEVSWHTQRRVTVGRIPLDEWSVRHRDLYLTTHNTHNRQTSMPLVGFEPTISAGERPKIYALDRAANGTGANQLYHAPHLNLTGMLFMVFEIKYSDAADCTHHVFIL